MKPLVHHAKKQLNPKKAKKEKEKAVCVLLYHPPHYLNIETDDELMTDQLKVSLIFG